MFRYVVVRFAYAGESRRESRRVVKDDGREERASGKEDLDADAASSASRDVEDDEGIEDCP